MDKNTIEAKRIYDTICTLFDEWGCEFRTDANLLTIVAEDLGVNSKSTLKFVINDDKYTLNILSSTKISLPESLFDDVIELLCDINSSLKYGNFIIELTTGDINYSYNLVYKESIISKESLEKMLNYIIATMEEYKPKLSIFLR